MKGKNYSKFFFYSSRLIKILGIFCVNYGEEIPKIFVVNLHHLCGKYFTYFEKNFTKINKPKKLL